MQKPASFRTWAEQTPDDFVFSLKGGRFITHMKRLRDVDVARGQLLRHRACWRSSSKLGAVLWQLPPNLPFDAELVDAFLTLLPRRHASRPPTWPRSTTTGCRRP